MKNCPNCFEFNNDEAEHCQRCEAKFPVWKGSEPKPLNQDASERAVGGKPHGVVWAFVIAVALIIGALFLFWFLAAIASSGMSDT